MLTIGLKTTFRGKIDWVEVLQGEFSNCKVSALGVFSIALKYIRMWACIHACTHTRIHIFHSCFQQKLRSKKDLFLSKLSQFQRLPVWVNLTRTIDRSKEGGPHHFPAVVLPWEAPCVASARCHQKLVLFRLCWNITVWLPAVLRSRLRVLFPWKLPSWDNRGMLSSNGSSTKAASLCQSDPQTPGKSGRAFPLKWIKQQSFSPSRMWKTVISEQKCFAEVHTLAAFTCSPLLISPVWPLNSQGTWLHFYPKEVQTQGKLLRLEQFYVLNTFCLQNRARPDTTSVPNECLWNSVLGNAVIRQRNRTLGTAWATLFRQFYTLQVYKLFVTITIKFLFL